MRNGPDTSAITRLPIGSEVRVYREGKGWTGPHKFLGMTANQTCSVELRNGPTEFRSTVVMPYRREANETQPGNNTSLNDSGTATGTDEAQLSDTEAQQGGEARNRSNQSEVVPEEVQTSTNHKEHDALQYGSGSQTVRTIRPEKS